MTNVSSKEPKHKRLTRGYHGLMTLYLYDEAPNIGAGYRLVTVRIGNKRVWLMDAITLKRKIIPRATFDMIEIRSLKAMRGRTLRSPRNG